MLTYRAKPLIVAAMRLDNDASNAEAVIAWLRSLIPNEVWSHQILGQNHVHVGAGYDPHNPLMFVHVVLPGWWVVLSGGRIEVMDDATFNAKYEPEGDIE